MKRKSRLIAGRIPAHQDCPFAEHCLEKTATHTCKHMGVKHPCEFSCATARAFDRMLHDERLRDRSW